MKALSVYLLFKGHTVLEKEWDAPVDICIIRLVQSYKERKRSERETQTCVFSVVNALALPNTSETLLTTRKQESQNAKLHF